MEPKKINIVLEKSLLIRLDKKAQVNMKSRSCYVRDLIREYIQKENQESLVKKD